MATIKVKKDAQAISSPSDSLKSVVAKFCFYYSAYTYDEAMELSIKTMKRMIKVAYQEKAREYLELAQIARTAQSSKPAPYNKLVARYEREANG